MGGWAPEHDDGAGDGAGRGGRDAVDERFYPMVVRETPEVRCRDDHEQVAREKNADRGGGGPEGSGDEVA